MRDSEIEQRVVNEIRLMTYGRVKELCVLSVNGVVTLRGSVASPNQKHAADVAASRAKGVIAVISHLQAGRRISRKPPSLKTPVTTPATISQTVAIAALPA